VAKECSFVPNPPPGAKEELLGAALETVAAAVRDCPTNMCAFDKYVPQLVPILRAKAAGSPAAPTLAATCPRPHVPGMCPKGGDLARGAAVGGAAVGCDGRARVGAARDA